MLYYNSYVHLDQNTSDHKVNITSRMLYSRQPVIPEQAPSDREQQATSDIRTSTQRPRTTRKQWHPNIRSATANKRQPVISEQAPSDRVFFYYNSSLNSLSVRVPHNISCEYCKFTARIRSPKLVLRPFFSKKHRFYNGFCSFLQFFTVKPMDFSLFCIFTIKPMLFEYFWAKTQ